jgi:hypothetical protein
MQRRSPLAEARNARLSIVTARSWPTPTLTSVSPSALDAAGGEAVTVTGSGFLDSALSFYFGTAAATAMAIVSNTSLTCVTPAHSAGSVTCVVRTRGGDASLENGATYSSGGSGFRILLETGDDLLMETGDALRLE